jgi:hypothetical protein
MTLQPLTVKSASEVRSVNSPVSIMDASQPIWDMKKTAEIELSAAYYATSSACYCVAISSVGDWELFKVL